MSTHRRARLLAIPLALVLSLGAVLSTTACDVVSRDWAWTMGKTHGVIVETTAGRASLGVYRVPSRALYGVLKAKGTSEVQRYLWRYGKPPALRKTFTYRGLSYTVQFGAATAALRSLTHKLIYDDPADLRSAVIDAHRADSCLALTLVSYGKPTSNWTQKQVGCQNGSIG